VRDRGPAVCRLIPRQATMVRKTSNCLLRERSIIATLQGLLLPQLIIQDRRGKVKHRSRRASPSQTTGEPGLTDHVRKRRVVMILGDEKGRPMDHKSPGSCSSPGSAPRSPRIFVLVPTECESLRYLRYRRGTTLGSEEFCAVHVSLDLYLHYSCGGTASISLIYQF